METYKKTMEILKNYVENVHDGKIRRAASALKLRDASVLSQWLNGDKKPRLEMIAPVLDIIGAKILPPDEELREYSIVVKRTARAGAGSSLETGEEVDGYFAFRRDWLSKIGVNAENAVMIDVVGDSMEPILKAGDTLLVDTNDKVLLNGQIYVVTLWDELLVKRIIKEMAGIYLHSENVRYPDICVAAADLGNLQVHGRVRWVGKEL